MHVTSEPKKFWTNFDDVVAQVTDLFQKLYFQVLKNGNVLKNATIKGERDEKINICVINKFFLLKYISRFKYSNRIVERGKDFVGRQGNRIVMWITI